MKSPAVAFAARKDLGEAIANILTSEGHENKTYALSGNRAYSFKEVAAELTSLSGKNVLFNDVDEAGYIALLKQFGLPQDIDELMNHNWVVQTTDNRVVNNFAAHNLNTGEQIVVNYQPQFLLSNGLQGLHMASSNQVIALAPDYLAKHEIERGKLVEILPEWEFGESHLYLIRNPHLINQLEQEIVDFIFSLFADDCKDLHND
mgnify:CR=1 FL=1